MEKNKVNNIQTPINIIKNNNCFDNDNKVHYITSFNSEWYKNMISIYRNNNNTTNTNSNNKPNIHIAPLFELTVLNQDYKLKHQNLIIFHEDNLDSVINEFSIKSNKTLTNICLINLNNEYEWLEYELSRYYSIAGYFDPVWKGNIGSVKSGHALLYKVLSIYHSIYTAATGSIIFWVDTDVSFRKPLTDEIIEWIGHRDVSFIPLWLRNSFILCAPTNGTIPKFNQYALDTRVGQEELLHDEWWTIETGLFALTVNDRTRRFAKKALELYRGDMYNLARVCLGLDSVIGSNVKRTSSSSNTSPPSPPPPYCTQERYKKNLFLNDIFAYGLLLQSDIHQDAFFNVGLKIGLFGMLGVTPWGDRIHKHKWGNSKRSYGTHFHPVPSVSRGVVSRGNTTTPVAMATRDTNTNSSIIASFAIGEYIFHHFGAHKTGNFVHYIHI